MPDEVKEVVPSIVERNPDGTWARGKPPGPGRGKGNLDRVTLLMKQQLAAHLEATGEAGNPLVVLCKIYQEADNHPLVRARAIEILLRHISPMLLRVEQQEPSGSTDTEIASLKQALKAVLLKGLPGAGPTPAR